MADIIAREALMLREDAIELASRAMQRLGDSTGGQIGDVAMPVDVQLRGSENRGALSAFVAIRCYSYAARANANGALRAAVRRLISKPA